MLATFKQALEKTKSVEEVLSLVLAAKPYLNRHRYFFWDWFINKNNVNTWKNAFKEARVKGLTLLQNAVKNKNPNEARSYLGTWRKQVLFAEHRNESILKGAFGRTQAQVDIDSMLKKIK